jgi:hypothetical protein
VFCANCGVSNSDSARFCAKCGTALGGSAPLVAGGAAAALGAPAGGLRRDGDLLLVGRGATLPPYCVKCGQPAEKFVSKNFGWHSPWLYLLILLNVLIYAIIATVVMKRMKLDVPLCAEHRRRRTRLLWAGGLLLAGALPLGITIGVMGNSDDMVGVGVLVGFACFIASIVLLVMGNLLMRPKVIDENQAIFTGVNPAFLQYVGAQAPAAPTGR